MSAQLERAGRRAYTLDLMPNNGDLGLDQMALQIGDFAAKHFGAEQRFDLLGFSMGGIVSRFYVQRMGGIQRVRRFITVSSPHHGTWTAWLWGSPGIRQMRPGSAFLRDLNKDCDILQRVGFVSLWTAFDLMILPAKSSVLPVGQSIHVGVFAHRLMVTDSRVLALTEKILSEPAAPQD